MTGNVDHPIAPAEAHANFLRAVLTLDASKPAELSPEATNPTDGVPNRLPAAAREPQDAAARRAGRANAPPRRKR